MSSSGLSALQPPRRADARRNFERLLREARVAFAEGGVNASLEDIARRAGVGIGTLYRHFPTREALLEAVIYERAEALGARGTELLVWVPASDALSMWVREAVTHTASYRGLAASLLEESRNKDSRLYASCKALQHAGAELLTRAQAAGAVREDVGSTDLFSLITAVAWTSEQDGAQGERLLSLMLRGLWR